jgi:uncharacterized protein (DUF58 family)
VEPDGAVERPEPEADAQPRTAPGTRTRLELMPRGRVVLVLLHLALAAAWLGEDDHARIAASLLATPLLVDLWTKLRNRPDVRLRIGPRRTIARAPYLEPVTVEAGRSPVHALRFREPQTHVRDAGGMHVPFLPAGTSHELRSAARSLRRGVVHERSFAGETAWPLGMFRWRIEVSVDARLLTEPARATLPPAILAALAAADAEARAGRRDGQDEFHALREYRDGEDARLVHARRSAALGEPVRRVLRGSPAPRCAVVVDLRRPPGMPPSFGRRRLEQELSRAAALADAIEARGLALLGYVIGNASTERTESAAGAPPTAFLEALAVARSADYRILVDDELAELDSVDTCFWLAAGGHEDPKKRRDPQLHFLESEAS